MKPTKPLRFVKGMRTGFESIGAEQSEQYSWIGKTKDKYVLTAEIDHIDEKDNVYKHVEGTFRKYVRPLSIELGESPATIRHAQELLEALSHAYTQNCKCHLMLLKGTKYGQTNNGIRAAIDGDYWTVHQLSGDVSSGFDFLLQRTS